MTDKKIKNIFVEGAISADFIADVIKKHSSNQTIGAHSVFLGQVRADVVNNNTVSSIEYTTYKSMALEKMQEIRESIFEKFTLTCMHVYHSLGNVAAGQICLFVFTSAVHRKEAIDACEELVENIKKELPIWGKEIFDTEKYQWKENK